MPESDYTIRVERLDRELITVDGLAVARAFFLGDPSSQGERSFDLLAGRGNRQRIEVADVEAINRTMRTRSAHARWSSLIEGDFEWRSIPTDLDLIESDDDEWADAHGDVLVARGFEAVIGPYRGLAVAGKMLHLKRPKLFPVLDRLVAEMLGVPVPTQAASAQMVSVALQLTTLIRREGRRNLGALSEVRDALSVDGITRELARVFDAIMWFAHPAASVWGVRRGIQVHLRD